ncbi:MAG: biopolymer transporter ExbD [Pseudomonadota bacterium]
MTMLDLGTPPPARPRERILPMINVAFLLLIMVVMLAEFTAPAPFDVIPPESAREDRAGQEMVLFIRADGAMNFRGTAGEEAVFAELAAICGSAGCGPDAVLSIKADQDVSGVVFAQVLGRLQSVGFDQVEIVTVLP